MYSTLVEIEDEDVSCDLAVEVISERSTTNHSPSVSSGARRSFRVRPTAAHRVGQHATSTWKREHTCFWKRVTVFRSNWRR